MAGVSLLVAVVAALAVPAARVEGVVTAECASRDVSSISYRVTFRDFLPSHCIRSSVYSDDYEWASYSGAADSLYSSSTLPANLFGNTSLMDLHAGSDGPSYSNDWSNQIKVANYCPYWSSHYDGSISGHPDFEAAARSKVSGASKCFKGGVAQSCKGLSSVIKPDLVLADSGLPKVVYCSDDPEGRCGGNGGNPEKFTTSRGKYFDAWFNDDPKYNKRVGDTLTLALNETDNTYFYYNSSFFPLTDYDGFTTQELIPDHKRAKVWPNSLLDVGAKHFWFTTELHTYFEYNGNETFRFSGDDDVWVFINDKLAIDLGSTHPEDDDDIFLSDYAGADFLNLTVGNVYSFSMFHAERHYSQSNFKVTTTLSSACNVVRSGVTTFQLSGAAPDDVSYGIGSALNASENHIVLVSPQISPPSASTFAFVAQQQNVGTGFIVTFTFSASEVGTTDGFAFVMHQRPDGLVDFPISTGRSLGFKHLTHSVAIAFDLCADRDEANSACETQSVRVHYPNAPEDRNGPGADTLRVLDGITRSLRFDGEEHEVRIQYLETPAWLEVYIDDSLYLRQVDFDPEAILGGRNAYVGLTASTDETPATITITEMEIVTVQVAPGATVPVDLEPSASAKPLLANGEAMAGFSLQTRDCCMNLVQYGGFGELMKGWFVPLDEDATNSTGGRRFLVEDVEAAAIPAEIIDNGDGTYMAALRSDLPGEYALFACFGETCGYNFTDMTPMTDETVDFYSMVPRAVSARPVTSMPTVSPIDYVAPPPESAEAVQTASMIGGSAAGLLAILMLGLFVMRRRWQRDRAFIDQGKLYMMDREVQYDKNDEYSVIGRMVMSTTATLQRERAQLASAQPGDSVEHLSQQNAELMEQLRITKQQQEQAAVMKGRNRFSRFVSGAARPQRKQFSTSVADADNASL